MQVNKLTEVQNDEEALKAKTKTVVKNYNRGIV